MNNDLLVTYARVLFWILFAMVTVLVGLVIADLLVIYGSPLPFWILFGLVSGVFFLFPYHLILKHLSR